MLKVADLTLSPRDNGGANSIVLVAEEDAPGKARTPYKAAIKALDKNDTDEGIKQLQLAVKAVPKFADGWTFSGRSMSCTGCSWTRGTLYSTQSRPILSSPRRT